jgi:hypothetical protein
MLILMYDRLSVNYEYEQISRGFKFTNLRGEIQDLLDGTIYVGGLFYTERNTRVLRAEK